MPNPRPKTYVAWASALALLALGALAAEVDEPREDKITAKQPVEVSSKQMTFDRSTGMTEFKGKVKVVHGGTVLEADDLAATSENRQATAEDNVRVVDKGMAATLTCGHLEYRDSMKYMSAHNDPVLTSQDDQGQSVTLKSRQMEFYQDKGEAVANQDVRLYHPQGKAVAGKATFLEKERRVILEQEPKFTNVMGTVTGRRLTAYLDDNRIVAEGNVEVNFFPTPQPGDNGPDTTAPTAPPRNGGPAALPKPGTVATATPVAGPGAAGTPTPAAQAVATPVPTPGSWTTPPGTAPKGGWGTAK